MLSFLCSAEAKTDARDLAYVMEVMQAMSKDPAAHLNPPPHTKLENATRKYHALVHFRPRFYAEVAPDVRRAYSVSYIDREAAVPQVVFGPATEMPAVH